MKINQKGLSGIFILLIILFVLGVGAGAYYFGKSSDEKTTLTPPPPPPPTSMPTSAPTVLPTITLTTTPIPTPTVNPNSNVYTSQTLGVTFNYTTKSTGINNSKIAVKEIGNKIYVYSASTQPESGQYLEMFAKDKNQTLIDAVKQKILANYSLNDCLVKTITWTFTGQSYPANFELAQIGVPTNANDDMETLSKKAEKCPAGYLAIGGLSYFLGDSTHPEKFIFLSIGQYAIDSGIGDKNWQNTIKFLP